MFSELALTKYYELIDYINLAKLAFAVEFKSVYNTQLRR